MAHSRWL